MASKRVWEDFDVEDDPLDFGDPSLTRAAVDTAAQDFGVLFAPGGAAAPGSEGSITSSSRPPSRQVDDAQRKNQSSSSVKGIMRKGSRPPNSSMSSNDLPNRRASETSSGRPPGKGGPAELGRMSETGSATMLSNSITESEVKKSRQKAGVARFATNPGQFIDSSTPKKRSLFSSRADDSSDSMSRGVMGNRFDLNTSDDDDDDDMFFGSASASSRPQSQSGSRVRKGSAGDSSIIPPSGPPVPRTVPNLSEMHPPPTTVSTGMTSRGRDKIMGLPERFRLPEGTEGCYQGFLERPKHWWSSKHTQHLFAIQHNVLLICSPNPPHRMQECIQLTSIMNVHAEGDCHFVIEYTIPKKNEKTKPTMMKVRAGNPDDRDRWVDALSFHFKRALAAKSAFIDFVEKDLAENRLQTMHAIIRNAGLYSLVARAFNTLEAKFKCELKWAFATWRAYVLAKALYEQRNISQVVEHKAEAEVKESQNSARIEIQNARKEASFKLAFSILNNLRLARLSYGILHLKRRIDDQYANEVTNAIASTMASAWYTEACLLADSQVGWKRRVLCRVPVSLYQSRLRDAFYELKGYGVIAKSREDAKSTKLLAILKRRRVETNSALTIVYVRWKEIIRLERLRDTMLLKIAHRKMAGEVVTVLNVWRLATIRQSYGDVVALNKLVSVLSTLEKKNLSSGFRAISAAANEKHALEAHQITANFGVFNQHLLSCVNQLPRDRGCVLLFSFFENTVFKRQQFGLTKLQLHSARQLFLLRSVSGAVSIIEGRMRWLKSVSLCKWRMFCLNKRDTETLKLNAGTILQMVCRSVLERRQFQCFRVLEKNAISQKFASDKDRLLTALDKIVRRGRMNATELLVEKVSSLYNRARKRCLFYGLSAFQLNASNTNMIRGLVRLHVLQRVVSIVDKLRIARLACAFACIRSTIENQQVNMQAHRADAFAKLQKSNKTAAAILARRVFAVDDEVDIYRALRDTKSPSAVTFRDIGNGGLASSTSSSPDDAKATGHLSPPKPPVIIPMKRRKPSPLKRKGKIHLKAAPKAMVDYLKLRHKKKLDLPRIPPDDHVLPLRPRSSYAEIPSVLDGRAVDMSQRKISSVDSAVTGYSGRPPSNSSDAMPAGMDSSTERALLEAAAFLKDENITGAVWGVEEDKALHNRAVSDWAVHADDSVEGTKYGVVPLMQQDDSYSRGRRHSVTVKPSSLTGLLRVPRGRGGSMYSTDRQGQSDFASDMSSEAMLAELSRVLNIEEVLEMLGIYSDADILVPPSGSRRDLPHRDRYVIEPGSTGGPIDEGITDLNNYDSLMRYVDNLTREIDAATSQLPVSGRSSNRAPHGGSQSWCSSSSSQYAKDLHDYEYGPQLIEELTRLASVASSDSRWRMALDIMDLLLASSSHRSGGNSPKRRHTSANRRSSEHQRRAFLRSNVSPEAAMAILDAGQKSSNDPNSVMMSNGGENHHSSQQKRHGPFGSLLMYLSDDEKSQRHHHHHVMQDSTGATPNHLLSPSGQHQLHGATNRQRDSIRNIINRLAKETPRTSGSDQYPDKSHVPGQLPVMSCPERMRRPRNTNNNTQSSHPTSPTCGSCNVSPVVNYQQSGASQPPASSPIPRPAPVQYPQSTTIFPQYSKNSTYPTVFPASVTTSPSLTPKAPPTAQQNYSVTVCPPNHFSDSRKGSQAFSSSSNGTKVMMIVGSPPPESAAKGVPHSIGNPIRGSRFNQVLHHTYVPPPVYMRYIYKND